MKNKITILALTVLLAILAVIYAQGVDSNYYIISGSSYNGNFELEPLLRLGEYAAETEEAQDSSYTIEFIDSNGNLLKTFGFEMSSGLNDYDYKSTETFSFFSVVVDMPKNTAKLAIKENTNILKEFIISQNAPVISDINIIDKGSGLYGIVWNASDDDGDKLSYFILYSDNDGTDWDTPNMGYLQDTSYLLDTSYIKGGEVIIKVIATDGFNEGEAVSEPFSVQTKSPSASIVLPAKGAEYRVDSGVTLEGYGYDAEDGFLEGYAFNEELGYYTEDNLLVWDIDGNAVGKGSYLTIENLSLGRHTLTLTATDSEGKSAAETAVITVTDELRPDVSIEGLSIYPENPRETEQGVFEDVFIDAVLFNKRTDVICDVSFYSGSALIESIGAYLPSNEPRYTEVKFTPQSAGDHAITAKIENCNLEESDTSNNEASVSFTIIPYDNTPPQLTLKTNPSQLWPPNDKPVNVAIYGSVTDDASGVDTNSIMLTINGEKKQLTLNNNENFNIVVPLIAKRAGQEKEGYKHNIELKAADNNGNAAVANAAVIVPHEQRKK